MADASDPRPVLYSILDDVVPCGDREVIKSVSSLYNGWHYESDPQFVLFWTRLFVQNPELVRRMEGAYNEIGRAFVDLERLHRAVYDKPARVPPAIVEMIRRRVLASWFASGREVLAYTVEGATATKAARDIQRHISEAAWRREFSS